MTASNWPPIDALTRRIAPEAQQSAEDRLVGFAGWRFGHGVDARTVEKEVAVDLETVSEKLHEAAVVEHQPSQSCVLQQNGRIEGAGDQLDVGRHADEGQVQASRDASAADADATGIKVAAPAEHQFAYDISANDHAGVLVAWTS